MYDIVLFDGVVVYNYDALLCDCLCYFHKKKCYHLNNYQK